MNSKMLSTQYLKATSLFAYALVRLTLFAGCGVASWLILWHLVLDRRECAARLVQSASAS